MVLYQKSKHNKNIENELEAWLSFMIDDSPERILELIEGYPSFREMYGDVYEICRNVEGVMNMFSKELQEIDQNTVQYMIEEQQERIDTMEKENEEMRRENEEMRHELQELKLLIRELKNEKSK